MFLRTFCTGAGPGQHKKKQHINTKNRRDNDDNNDNKIDDDGNYGGSNELQQQ